MRWSGCFVVKSTIPAHKAFVFLSCCNDLIADFLRVDADAASKGHLEGFEGVGGPDELILLDVPDSLCSMLFEPLHSDNSILLEPRWISRQSILLISPLLSSS